MDAITKGWAEYTLREAERLKTEARAAIVRFKQHARRKASLRSDIAGFGPLPALTFQLNSEEAAVYLAAVEVHRAQDACIAILPRVERAERFLARVVAAERAEVGL